MISSAEPEGGYPQQGGYGNPYNAPALNSAGRAWTLTDVEGFRLASPLRDLIRLRPLGSDLHTSLYLFPLFHATLEPLSTISYPSVPVRAP